MITCKLENLLQQNQESGYLLPLNKNQQLIELGEFLSIGRNSSNTLVLEDSFVSQRHARIEKKNSQFIIKDLRSRNGTWLNETPVLEAVLKPHDRIRFGETQFTFSFVKNKTQNSLHSKNEDWQKQLARLPAFASSLHTILIIGPSGSGKEVVAAQIHQLSGRKNFPYITINCSALSEQLVESELFGHRKGAFTGAVEDRCGAFESARGGTLFLDEIGDLPLSLQPKLLRALENQEIRPVGSDKIIKTDVRIVAATHKNLYEKVLKKEFREDLYHRLNVCRISPPALIERMEDFEGLLYQFAKDLRVRFSFSAVEKLKDHVWPGNIRELKNLVSRASAYLPGQQIEARDLDELLDPVDSEHFIDENLPPLKELEKELIIKNLEKFEGNQRRAAEVLKMPKSTFHDRLKCYGINPKHFKKRGRI
jgi:DNA-binding NtrC family response regulator